MRHEDLNCTEASAYKQNALCINSRFNFPWYSAQISYYRDTSKDHRQTFSASELTNILWFF